MRVIPNKLLKEEEEAIIDYALIYPEQRHREIQFNLDTFPFPVSNRRLKERNLVKEHHLKAPKHKKGRPTASCVHEIWLVDITFVLSRGRLLVSHRRN